jgi:MFS family permease
VSVHDDPRWSPMDADPPGGEPQGWAPRPEQPAKVVNPRTGPLPMHPMGLSDVLDGAFKLYKGNARSVILITAAFMLPVQLLTAFLQRDVLGGAQLSDLVNDPSTLAGAESGDGGMAGALLAMLTTALIMPLVAGAVCRVVAASYLAEELTPADAVRAVAPRWWAFAVAWILVHLLEAIGTLLLVLPGLLAMALMVAVAPALAIEGLGPVRAMKRSARLVRPRMFPVLGIAVASGLLASALGVALGFIPQALAVVVGLEWGWPLLALGSVLTAVVVNPFVAIVATLVYFDGRIRREGLDLQVMAAQMAGGGGEP